MQRFDVYLVSLDPTQGSEIRKTLPCVIISPEEMHSLNTVLVAPMTTKGFHFPTRISVTFQGKKGQIVLDQIRAVDKSRLVKKLGRLRESVGLNILSLLQEMFTL